MGVDWTAYATVGVRVKKASLYCQVTRPGCVHGDRGPAHDHNFCPVCGKPAAVTEREPLPQYDVDTETLCGFPVVSDDAEAGAVIVGVLVARAIEGRATAKVSLEECVARKPLLQAALAPLGLWDEASFGVWAALRGWC